MTDTKLILLPGLDGTGELFRPFLAVVPRDQPTRVVAYPCDKVLRYADLLELVEQQLMNEPAVVLVAESFSGPIALRYAAANPHRVRAVVLCASFVRPPMPRWLRWFVWPFVFWLPPPGFVVRRLMVGRDAPDALVRVVKRAIRTVTPAVLSRRLKDVLKVDCTEALRRCSAPILYLAGSRDVIVRRSSLDAILAIRADVAVCVIAGPHLLMQRQPAAAWGAMERFLIGVAESQTRDQAG